MPLNLILFLIAALLVLLAVPYVGTLAAIGGLYAFLSFIVGILRRPPAQG